MSEEKEYYEIEDIKTKEKQKVSYTSEYQKEKRTEKKFVKGTKDIFDLDKEEFIFHISNICENKEKTPFTKEFYSFQQKHLGCMIVILFFFMLFPIVLFLFVSFFEITISRSFSFSSYYGPRLLIFLFINALIWIYLWRVTDNFYKKAVFKAMGFEYFDGKRALSKYAYDIKNIARKFSEFLFRTDDIIFSKYKEYDFAFFDCIEKIASHKIFLAVKTDKKFSSQTFINSKSRTGNNFFEGKEVNLEDIEFSKMFYTLSQDQVEARYLLTPSFMTRLLLLSYTKKYNQIQVLFSNKYSDKYNVFFYFPTQNNLFEMKINIKRREYEEFYDFLCEIKKFIDIVDALKLDQDIGM